MGNDTIFPSFHMPPCSGPGAAGSCFGNSEPCMMMTSNNNVFTDFQSLYRGFGCSNNGLHNSPVAPNSFQLMNFNGDVSHGSATSKNSTVEAARRKVSSRDSIRKRANARRECKRRKTMIAEEMHHDQSPHGSIATTQAPPKRNQKLGEKVTALQQLVSPFGKTDTSSVLLEAAVYIKDMQEKIEVLTMPYLRHTLSPHWQSQQVSTNLRQRGLCLGPAATMADFIREAAASDQRIPTTHS